MHWKHIQRKDGGGPAVSHTQPTLSWVAFCRLPLCGGLTATGKDTVPTRTCPSLARCIQAIDHRKVLQYIPSLLPSILQLRFRDILGPWGMPHLNPCWPGT